MVHLPQEDESLDYKEQLSSQYNKSCRILATYLTEMMIAYAKGRSTRNIIHTNEQGVIIGLWNIVLNKIQQELNKMFVFQLTEVVEGYLETYLKDSLSKDLYKWRKH
jgi:ribosomal protein S3